MVANTIFTASAARCADGPAALHAPSPLATNTNQYLISLMTIVIWVHSILLTYLYQVLIL